MSWIILALVNGTKQTLGVKITFEGINGVMVQAVTKEFSIYH